MTSWPHVALADVAELRAGTGFPLEFQGRSDEAYPFAKVSDISAVARSGAIEISEAAHSVSEQDLQTLRVTPFPPGTVAFAKIGEAIRQNYRVVTTRPMLFDNNVMGLIPDAKQIDGRFLLRFLQTQDFYARTGRTAVPAIRSSILRAARVPLPPLPEQQRIAAILDQADLVRRKRQQTLHLADQFLRSAFLDMFGDPVTNPRGWPVRKLFDAFVTDRPPTKCGPFGSALRKEEYVEAGIPALTMDNTVGDAFTPQGCLFVTAEKAAVLSQYEVQSGDIIVSRAGTVGKMCVVPELGTPAIISTNLIRLSLNPGVLEPSYFVALMSYCRGRLGNLRTGADGAYSFMNTGVLESLRLPFPSVHAQRSWFQLRSAVDQYAASMKRDEATLADLSTTLASRAFRGELGGHGLGAEGPDQALGGT